MSKFRIITKAYPAKCFVFNALNAYADSEIKTALYEKACRECETGEILLDTLDELKFWRNVLNSYKPRTTIEWRISRAMRAVATTVINDGKCNWYDVVIGKSFS